MMFMNQESKLILALLQIDNLIKLIEGNEYQKFLYGRLISIQCELRRQLTNLKVSANIQE
jgi:hypothetical protein